MRRILTVRTSTSRMQEVLSPYINKSHRILYTVRGNRSIAAVFRLRQGQSSLHGIFRCDDIYVPANLLRRKGSTVLPALPSSHMVMVEGESQTVDASTKLVEWRRLNPHYYGYRSKLNNVLVG